MIIEGYSLFVVLINLLIQELLIILFNKSSFYSIPHSEFPQSIKEFKESKNFYFSDTLQ